MFRSSHNRDENADAPLLSGHFKVTIIRATGLRAPSSSFSKTDLFCSCEVEEQPHIKIQSGVLATRGDPVWNYAAEMEGLASDNTLKFTVWGRDWGRRNQSLGWVTLKASQFEKHGFAGNLPLFGAATSKAYLQVSVKPAKPEEAPTVTGLHIRERLGFFGSGSHLPPVGQSLQVSIVSAEGLRKADIMGLSDPYCICEIPEKPGSGFQTHTVRRSLAPTWNCENEVAYWTGGDPLQFSVYDKDWGKFDDLLGRAVLTSDRFYPDGFEGDLDLEDAGRGVTAKLRVKVAPVPMSVNSASPGGFLARWRGRPAAACEADQTTADTQLTQPSSGSTSRASATAGSTRSLKRSTNADASTEASTTNKPYRTLRVGISRATGLRQADWMGLSDPYCICEIPGKPRSAIQTGIVKSSLNPEWNHEDDVHDYAVGDTLIFTVWDKDWGQQDDLLGRVILKKEQFHPKGFEGEVELLEAGDALHPMLHIKIAPSDAPQKRSFTGFHIRERMAKVITPSGNMEGMPSPTDSLQVIIVSATGLRGADWSGLSDPYCVCEIQGKPGSSRRTQVISKTREPIWCHQADFAEYSPGDRLVFTVWDQDWAKGDELLGRVSVPDTCFQRPFEDDLVLEEAGKGIHATLRVKIIPPAEKDTIEITIISATSLRNADWVGRSNPYCTCEIAGKDNVKLQTKTLDHNLHPNWDQSFNIKLGPEFVEGDSLTFTVWDENWVSKPDLLGKAFLTSDQFFPYGFSGDLKLSEAGGARAKLKVRIKVRRHSKLDFKRVKKAAVSAFYARREELMRRIMTKVVDMTEPQIDKGLEVARDAIKTTLTADPDMWRWLRRAIHGWVDILWYDIGLEVKSVVRDLRGMASGRTYMSVQALGELGQRPYCCSLMRVRAWILYHFLPYDKSIFGTFGDPVYLLFMLLAFIPDVRVLFYGMILSLLVFPWPPDEFQLVQFIMMFKGMQFLSSGLTMALVGGIEYYLCVGIDNEHTCDKHGPGTTQSTVLGAIDIVGSCALVWVAFRLLDCSAHNVGYRQDDYTTDEKEGDSEHSRAGQGKTRGGRLRGWLRYDLGCFGVACAMLVSLEIFRNWKLYKFYFEHVGKDAFADSSWQSLWDHAEHWIFRSSLFWTRVFYSLLALPFMFFNIPALQPLLTHTIPTGFNVRGHLVAFQLHPMPDEEDP